MIEKWLAVFSGLVLGMILNVLADMLPVMRRMGRPICPNCGAAIGWLNYLIWPRKCPNCSQRRSARTWIVEAGMMLAGYFLVDHGPVDLGLAGRLILVAYLALVTIIDIEHRLIMHIISLFGVALSLWIGVVLHGWAPTLLGGLAGFLVMLAFYYTGVYFVRFSRKLRGLQTSEDEAIGFGDVNLSGIIGLLLGWPGIALGLFFAIMLAGLASLLYLIWALSRKSYHSDLALPYGPFLTISAFILLFLK